MTLALWKTLLIAAISASAAAAAVYMGSAFLMCTVGILFAYPLCRGGYAAWLAAPAAYVLTLALSGDLLYSLSSLVFIVTGAALAICVKKKCRLSVTAAVLTVTVAITVGVLFFAAIYSVYGALFAGFTAYINDLRAAIAPMIAQLRSITDENGFTVLTDQVIASMKESFLMTAPGITVIVCELFALVMAKLFVVVCKIFNDRALLPDNWHVHTALPTSVLFVISYTVCFFAPSAGIVAYSALNLMMILLPLTSISGFHSMFGANSAFRTTKSQTSKILMVVICIVFFFINPLMPFATFAFWGTFEDIRKYLQNKRNSNTPD